MLRIAERKKELNGKQFQTTPKTHQYAIHIEIVKRRHDRNFIFTIHFYMMCVRILLRVSERASECVCVCALFRDSFPSFHHNFSVFNPIIWCCWFIALLFFFHPHSCSFCLTSYNFFSHCSFAYSLFTFGRVSDDTCTHREREHRCSETFIDKIKR